MEDLPADAEGIGSPAVGGELLDSLRCFPARHGLGIAWARVEDHPPEPLGLGPLAPLLGQDGEVAQCQVAVDAPVDAAELIGSFDTPR